MYICICNQITDSQLREEIDRGNETVHALRENLGVTNQCGKCGSCVKKCIRQHIANSPDFLSALACNA